MWSVLERLAALILLVLWAPALAVIALLIRLTSPGPAIYRQIRLGKGKKEFVIYKLRTMFVGVQNGAVVTPDDPRVTKIGRFLRRTRMDETPQFWNIVRGEMVFVGPRPHNRAGSSQLQREFGKRYTNRYLLMPGLWGLTHLLWVRGEGLRRMVACDEFFRIHYSDVLVAWVLWKTLTRICKSKAF